MDKNNKSYRIKTNINSDNYISVNLEQDYDSFDILSLKINGIDTYKQHSSKHGVIVGRVLANNGFGVPNAKISIFIESESPNDINSVYPFRNVSSKDNNGVRYNLLPDNKVSDCHQIVGTFPNKRYMLDNNILVEVFDKYYKYTTRTNNSGDYMLACVPVGQHVIHMDLDLSDCGILSQRPRDFIYKGYSVEQFENPNQFKSGTEFDTLSQIFSQNQVVYVQPFWGNDSQGDAIGITRADINIAYKFEPTCVFIGCVVSDNSSQGISKNCVPTQNMGNMDELVTGKGRIEMIRKTYAGDVEEFQIKGTELINGDGIWCYQIPMNLDYMATDEYGNLIPTDNPEIGIPTRARVRFRMSMEDMEENTDNYFRAKVLVPHNPQNLDGNKHEDYDYEFGTYTKDESFRDLFWNNVYTVKSYIPRFQKRKVLGWNEKKFTGIKHCQDYGSNNPIPYNNIRIKLPFMFRIMCILIKVFIKVVAIYNRVVALVGGFLAGLAELVNGIRASWAGKIMKVAQSLHLNVIEDGLCPDLENWYFAPLVTKNGIKTSQTVRVKTEDNGKKHDETYDLIQQTMDVIDAKDEYEDHESVDYQNDEGDNEAICITFKTDYLISCIEMNLAQEYKVINFDFYNDWVNGMIYFPRWMRYVRLKRRFRGNTIVKSKTKACMDNTKIFAKSRRYTQMCSLAYNKTNTNGHTTYSKVVVDLKKNGDIKKANNYHKKRGFSQVKIFGKNGGICHEKETMVGQHVYYLKPCEWQLNSNPKFKKINLFATDLVLLGSLNDCDIYGVPQAFRYLSSTSYIMPTNLALTNMETDGMLYAYGDNKTMCSKKNQSTKDSNDPNLNKPVQVADNTLSAELAYYSGASENYDVNYEDDDVDTIPMTEAAGISWNYTGPGQNEMKPKSLYYPGGHFLGLSCSNSQTNIKSCINLERICEQGVVMSQRKVDVRAVETAGATDLKYVYTAPSGLIAKDEIIDDYFRSMFATMNQRRLIATKMNEKTGYLMYEFEHVYPTDFNGEFTNYVKPGTPYNDVVQINDESNALSAYGIVNGARRSDYDSDETLYTQIRTIEDISVDYYRFRLGLDYSDLTQNSNKHKRQFAAENQNQMYLPQYENSYYFYFGLNAGSTAIDEFNKEFFSQCENSLLLDRESNMIINVSDFSLCEGASDVTIRLENMESPYEYIVYSDGGNIVTSYTGNDIAIQFTLPSGMYQIVVRDTNGVELTKTINVGMDLFNGMVTTVDFNSDITNDFNGSIARNAENKNIFFGGCVVFDGVNIDETIENYWIEAYPYDKTQMESEEVVDYNGSATIYLCSANTKYDLYIGYQANGCERQHIFIESVEIFDNSIVSLTIGAAEQYPVSGYMYSDNWWVGRYTEPIDTGNTESCMRWNIAKSLANPYCNSAATKSSYVRTNGDKVVFGTPQRFNGVYSSQDLFVDDYNTPSGYNVDDDYSYYATYGRMQSVDMKQFNTISHLGSVVHGSFNGFVSGHSGTDKEVTFPSGSMQAVTLRNGGGCVFKALPSGILYPAISYLSGGLWYVKFVDNNESLSSGWNDEEYGVVYPTIVYPSIQRQFTSDISYCILKRVIVSDNAEIDYLNWFARCDGEVWNGMTYNGYYGGGSHIDLYAYSFGSDKTILPVSPELPLLPSTIEYFNGVTATASNPNRTYISGGTFGSISADTGGIVLNEIPQSFSYEIIEGYPKYKLTNNGLVTYSAINLSGSSLYNKADLYENVAEHLYLELDGEFYENINYCVEGNSYIFGATGNADSNISYYYLPNELTHIIAPQTENTIVYRKAGYTDKWPEYIYVICVYGSDGTVHYQNEEVVVTFERVVDTWDGFQNGWWNVRFEDANGNEVFKYDSDHPDRGYVQLRGACKDVSFVEELLTLFSDKMTNEGLGDMINFRLYQQPSDLSLNYKVNVLGWCKQQYKIENGRYPYPSDATQAASFCVAAVKHFQNETGRALGDLVMVYVNPSGRRTINEDEILK